MLPPEWKKEIEETINQAQTRSDEARERAQHEQIAAVSAPLHSLRNHFRAYIISVPTLIEEIQLFGVCGRKFLRCIVIKQAIDRGFLEQGETQNL